MSPDSEQTESGQEPLERLAAVRALMASAGYDALFVPRADEYLGEYIPERNERLHWLTGFTGSAGMAVVLADSAAIFVDGRYTVQVRNQVDAQCYEYLHLIDTPSVQWLGERLAKIPSQTQRQGLRVACDPRLHTLSWFRSAQKSLEAFGIELIADTNNLIDRCWQQRPAPVISTALLLDDSYTGESSSAKRERIGRDISTRGADAALIFQPDSISWLLNVRGTDMPQLPVLQSTALLRSDGALDLFVQPERLPDAFGEHVGERVQVHAENKLVAALKAYKGLRVIADPAGASAAVQLALREAGATLVAGEDPVVVPKACKNSVEQSGSRAAHQRDAVAEINFLAWLDSEVANGLLHDEATLSDKLFSMRAAQEQFHACSFDTISAAGSNAAMCHYNHLNGVPAKLEMNSVYLVDSGGQYTDGTTDITRTVSIGDPGAEVRRLFTLVLKGHIALAQARFPMGTTGTQLDVLARQFLWQEGFDYDHGTGHGVGVFLSVHEGPQRISKAHNPVALQPGMIVSNEPGYYRDGQFGIRCENLVLVKEAQGSGEVPVLEFDTISLVPFDTRLLDTSLLDAAELEWLNSYHEQVAATIGPLLAEPERRWLQHATARVHA